MLERGAESMSNRIDQRIVEMSFENNKFEEGIAKSKNSLKGFVDALQNMGGGKDLSGLEHSVDAVSNKFSLLEQIGVGALRRIGESAVDAGARMIKHLTLDPLTMGFSKYEQKTASVQTIMNATGKSIDEVNGYLNKLMWFSDETSYGFTDMTAALAQMTSSGGDIDTLIPMITGVATATAYAGKGAAEFSRAMYNLNQSYGRGNLEYMDWKSLELAGVAGKDLKQIIIDTGKAMGALDNEGRTVKGTLVDIGSFGSTLSEKWASTKVMEASFSKFSEMSEAVYELVQNGTYDTAAEAMAALSGQYSILAEKGFKSAQQAKSFTEAINATLDSASSGWMRTYEIIFGEMDEAVRNFTALTGILWEVFSAGAEGRNEMLKSIKTAGGIKTIFQILKNVAVALLTPLRAISMAFDQFFPPKTTTQWMNIINILENVTKKMIISAETAAKIQRTFAGFFAVVDIGWEVVKFLGQALYEIVDVFMPLGDSLLDTTASIGDFLVMLNKVIKQSGVFQYGLLGVKIAAVLIKSALSSIVGKVSEFVRVLWTTDKPLEFLGSTVLKIFSGILEVLKTTTKWISSSFIDALSSVFKFFGSKLDISDTSALGGVLTFLKEFVGFLVGEGSEGIKTFNGTLQNLNFSRIATFVTGGVLLLFINQLSNLTNAMAGVANSTTGFITSFSKKLFGYTTKIKDLAYVIGVLTASLYVLSKIPWDKMKTGLKGMAGALVLFVGAYGAIQAITVASSKALNGIDVIKSTFSLVSLASGVAVMAFAISKLNKIVNEGDIWKAVGVMGAMMALLAAYQLVSALISIIPGQTAVVVKFSGMTLGILGLVGIAALLGSIPIGQLKSGAAKLIGAVALIAAVQAVFAVVSRLSNGAALSLNLMGIAGGLLGLVVVIKLANLLTPSELSKGLGNVFLMGGVLAALQLMMNVAGVVGGGVVFKTHMFSMQMGIVSMIAIIALLGTMDKSVLQNGIKTIAKMATIIAGLELITALSAKIGGGNKLQRILGSVSLAMFSFVGLIGIINWCTDEQINRGLLTITKMLGIIVMFEVLSALASRISTAGAVTGLTAMTGMIIALLTVTAALSLLAMLDQEALKKAAVSLAIAVVAVGVMSVGISAMLNSLALMSTALGGTRTLLQSLIPGLKAIGIALAATIVLLGIIIIAAPLIDAISWSSLGKFAAGLVVLSGLVLGFSILAKTPGLVDGGAGLVMLISALKSVGVLVLATAGLFYILSTVLPVIDSMNWSSLGKFVTGLGVLGAMAVAITLLSGPLAALGATGLAGGGAIISGILIAVSGVATIIAAFAGLALVMQALFSGGTDFLLNGIDTLVTIAGGIGRFIGALAGGFNAELLVTYGHGLSKFADSVSTIQPNAFDGVESLARAMLVLTGTAFLSGLTKLILPLGTNSGELFGQQMKGLIDSFKRISITDATQVSGVITALAPMTENLTKLADAAGNIPNSGGALGVLFGNNDMNTFATKVSSFISKLASVPVIGAQHAAALFGELGPMATNFKKFVQAAENIPNSGGSWGAIFGDNDIDTFAYKLRGFVSALETIGTEHVKVSVSVLSAMVPMIDNLKKFAAVATDIPSSGGLNIIFTGNNDINLFAQKIVEFVESLNTMDIGEVAVANSNLKSMTTDMLPGLERFAALSNRLTFTGMESLINFAKKLKSFAGILKNVDFEVVNPALKSLAAINESFKVVGQSSIASATASFENNKAPFHASISKTLDEASSIILSKKAVIEIAFTSIISNALTQTRSYVGQFKVVGAELINGLKSGIDANSSAATVAAVKMTSDVVKGTRHGFAVESPSKVFAEIGKWLPAGLGKGIENNTKVAVNAGVSMAKGVEEAVRDATGVHSLSKLYQGIGDFVPKSLSSGMDKGKNALLSTAKDLGIDTGNIIPKSLGDAIQGGTGVVTQKLNNMLDILTGDSTISGLADAFGGNTGSTITDGIANSISGSGGKSGKGGSSKIANAVKTVAEDAYTIFKRYIDDRKEYHLISLEEELAEWENFSKKYAEGSRTRIKADDEVARVKMELDTKSFNNSKKWIEQEKYFKRVSLLEELALWEKVQARYAKGHEYRKEAERELFRLKQELQAAEYQSATDRIDEEKYYGRMNLTAELKAWKDIQKNYKKGSDERKKADREVFRLQEDIQKTNKEHSDKVQAIEKERNERRIQADEEYYSKVKEINDKLKNDIRSLTDEYENAVKARTQALYSAWGLFDKVDIPEADGQDLLKNLEDQVVAFDQWQAQIKMLSEKGISDGLLKELKEMGPKALPQLVALNKLSSTELTKYVGLWTEKSVSAKEQAIAELEDMRIQTHAQIQALTAQAQRDLDYYKNEWQDTLQEINRDTERQLAELEKVWLAAISDMTNGALAMLQNFMLLWNIALKKLVDDTSKQMAMAKANMMAMQNASFVQTWSASNGTPLSGAAAKVADSAKRMATLAKAVPEGMVNGINSGKPAVTKASTSLASTVFNTIKKGLKINSPSKVTTQLGMYAAQGFVEGLEKVSAYDASANLGQTALAAMNSSISDILNNDSEDLSITPVLDLTSVRSGMNDINSIFNSGSGLGLGFGMNANLLPINNTANQNGILTDIKNSLLSIRNQEVDLTGMLTIQVSNDKGEIVGIAETAIKDILRRESR